MFCYKCGHEIPEGSNSCENCNSPAKKRRRVQTRMVLGIIIFFIGIFTGIFTERIMLTENSSLLPNDKISEIKKTETEILVDFGNNPTDVKEEAPQVEQKTETIVPVALEAAKTPEDKPIVPVIEPAAEPVFEPAIAPAIEPAIESVIVPAIEPVKSEQSAEADIAYFPNENEAKEIETAINVKLPRQKFAKSAIIEESKGNNYHGIPDAASKEVIFASNRDKVNGKLTYQCYAKKDGEKEAVKLFDWPGNVWTPEPVPFADKIVFSSDSSSPEHIFLIDRNTQKAMALTKGKSKNMMPAVSPDGKKIAFVSNQKGRNSIWVMNIDGSEQSIVTSGAYDDREPRWADGGKAIVFTRIVENLKKSHILKVSYPEKTITKLVATERRNWLADVSPDGNYLAYTRSEGQNGSKNSIVLRELENGSEEILKLDHASENLRPIWAADSMSFVFHSIKKTGRSLHRAIFIREKN